MRRAKKRVSIESLIKDRVTNKNSNNLCSICGSNCDSEKVDTLYSHSHLEQFCRNCSYSLQSLNNMDSFALKSMNLV